MSVFCFPPNTEVSPGESSIYFYPFLSSAEALIAKNIKKLDLLRN